jgi:hypothetical protein
MLNDETPAITDVASGGVASSTIVNVVNSSKIALGQAVPTSSSPVVITTRTASYTPLPSGSGTVPRDGASAPADSKGKSTGAAIGGVFALLAAIALVLFLIRCYKRRKRVDRTQEIRSSWFYGGDVTEPEDVGLRLGGSLPRYLESLC